MSQPKIERSFPAYYREHRERYTTSRVTKIKGRPIWVLENLGGWSVNSIVIEGDDGLVVYDTGVCREQGELIAAEIARLSDKPVRAVVYSHHHADHCQGTDAIVSPEAVANGEVEVIAWSSFSREYRDENRVVGPIMGIRAAYMSGALLPPEELPYTGLGGRFIGGSVGTFIEPTKLIDSETDFDIAGVRFTLFLTGGEAASEIGMYLPDYRTALIADEVYISLPNLYTLRGAKFRDAMRWAAASEKVLARDVDLLLGCHMPPLEGREQIEQVLGVYQDAIQYNHDQAVRHILRGATAEELRTGLVELPGHLDLDPFTREMYGSVANNAAAQMTGYLGWFSGDATDLAPLPRAERASRTVALMGGRNRVIEAARAAFDDGDGQWCAELAGLCVSVDTEDREARLLKAAGLRLLGYAEQNALRRNFYLTGALELEGAFDPAVVGGLARKTFTSSSTPLVGLVDSFRYNLVPSRAGAQRLVVDMVLSDSGERARLELRHSVLRVDKTADAPDATLSLPKDRFLALASGTTTWDTLQQEDAVEVAGEPEVVARFLACFDLTPPRVQLHVR
ncbi:alkyl sulfatase dimerization domain-containing protein [Streptomyces sp. NPDC046942]|uniref:alkyl sulfatase dimerization domain-containing protein n=1 Tax=Streptomyces sp. NPDC046942 TaxID=3155137 RepID=UPI0033F2EA13